MPTGPVAVNVATGDLTYDSDLTGGGAGGEVTLDAASLTALESITVVDGGGTLSVDDGAGSLTVDAASLPLPTGAATAAKQPTLGTAGSASTDVITVQGIASGTAQPVSGTVTADTELPAAAALSDTLGNPTTPLVGAATLYWDGSQWVRWQRFVKELTVSAATLANVAGSASSVTLFASNANARGRSLHNDSTAVLYLKYGATASATSYTAKLGAGDHYEFPAPLYTGVVDGIWTSATGTARTTEV